MSVQRVGIYYGSSGGSTAEVAGQLAQALGHLEGVQVTLADIAKTDLSDLPSHDLLLLGCSTWNWGDLQDDWEVAFAKFSELDLQGVRVGFFGCGDQFGYPDTFGDALGILADAAETSGAVLVGSMPLAGYDCHESKAVRGDEWVGLLLDDDNEREKTPERLRRWLERLSAQLDMSLVPSA